jgi:hypothetical protein
MKRNDSTIGTSEATRGPEPPTTQLFPRYEERLPNYSSGRTAAKSGNKST